MAKTAVFTSSASQARCVSDHALIGADPHHADESKDRSLVAFRRNFPRRRHEGRVDRSAERAKRRHHRSLSGLRLPFAKVQVHVLHGDTLSPGVGFRPRPARQAARSRLRPHRNGLPQAPGCSMHLGIICPSAGLREPCMRSGPPARQSGSGQQVMLIAGESPSSSRHDDYSAAVASPAGSCAHDAPHLRLAEWSSGAGDTALLP